MAAILSGPQCVNWNVRPTDKPRNETRYTRNHHSFWRSDLNLSQVNQLQASSLPRSVSNLKTIRPVYFEFSCSHQLYQNQIRRKRLKFPQIPNFRLWTKLVLCHTIHQGALPYQISWIYLLWSGMKIKKMTKIIIFPTLWSWPLPTTLKRSWFGSLSLPIWAINLRTIHSVPYKLSRSHHLYGGKRVPSAWSYFIPRSFIYGRNIHLM